MKRHTLGLLSFLVIYVCVNPSPKSEEESFIYALGCMFGVMGALAYVVILCFALERFIVNWFKKRKSYKRKDMKT